MVEKESSSLHKEGSCSLTRWVQEIPVGQIPVGQTSPKSKAFRHQHLVTCEKRKSKKQRSPQRQRAFLPAGQLHIYCMTGNAPVLYGYCNSAPYSIYVVAGCPSRRASCCARTNDREGCFPRRAANLIEPEGTVVRLPGNMSLNSRNVLVVLTQLSDPGAWDPRSPSDSSEFNPKATLTQKRREGRMWAPTTLDTISTSSAVALAIGCRSSCRLSLTIQANITYCSLCKRYSPP